MVISSGALFSVGLQGSNKIMGFGDDKREVGRKLGIAQAFMAYNRCKDSQLPILREDLFVRSIVAKVVVSLEIKWLQCNSMCAKRGRVFRCMAARRRRDEYDEVEVGLCRDGRG